MSITPALQAGIPAPDDPADLVQALTRFATVLSEYDGLLADRIEQVGLGVAAQGINAYAARRHDQILTVTARAAAQTQLTPLKLPKGSAASWTPKTTTRTPQNRLGLVIAEFRSFTHMPLNQWFTLIADKTPLLYHGYSKIDLNFCVEYHLDKKELAQLETKVNQSWDLTGPYNVSSDSVFMFQALDGPFVGVHTLANSGSQPTRFPSFQVKSIDRALTARVYLLGPYEQSSSSTLSRLFNDYVTNPGAFDPESSPYSSYREIARFLKHNLSTVLETYESRPFGGLLTFGNPLPPVSFPRGED